MAPMSTIAHEPRYKYMFDILFGQFSNKDRVFRTLLFTPEAKEMMDFFRTMVGNYLPRMLRAQCISGERDEHNYMADCVYEAIFQIEKLRNGVMALPAGFPTPMYPDNGFLNHNEAAIATYVKKVYGWTLRYGCRADGAVTTPIDPIDVNVLGGGDRVKFTYFRKQAVLFIEDKLEEENITKSLTQGCGTAIALCEQIGATCLWVFGHSTQVIVPVFLEKCGSDWIPYAGPDIEGLHNAPEVVAALMLALLFPKGHARLFELLFQPSKHVFVPKDTREDAPDESSPSEDTDATYAPSSAADSD